MTTPSHPPLWQVMQKAHDATIAINHPFATNGQLRAAEIRAVRDWILQLPNGYDWSKMQAEALANVLTAQADFAERADRSDD